MKRKKSSQQIAGEFGGAYALSLKSGYDNNDIGTPTISCADADDVDGTGAEANAWIDVYTNDDNDTDGEI